MMPDIVRSVPVFIVNRNRVSSTRKLVDWLLVNGTHTITILDNGSTYPPLIEYYKCLPHSVRLLQHGNEGPMGFWFRRLHERQNEPYILTDSDCVPADVCPKNLVEKLFDLLCWFPGCGKVGAGLRTDNLHQNLANRNWVIEWESQWRRRRATPDAFYAKVDTTFAMYPPFGKFCIHDSNVRTDAPYLVEHWPWYFDSNDLPEEERYYWSHKDFNLTGWDIQRPL